jgi:MtN3 and saliva related transmembrane protein
MALVDALGLAAATAGILMAISPLLQIRRMLERHSSEDVSLGYLSVLQVGFLLWLSYGIALGNPALIVSNGTALVVGTGTLTVAVALRRARPPVDGSRLAPEPPPADPGGS